MSDEWIMTRFKPVYDPALFNFPAQSYDGSYTTTFEKREKQTVFKEILWESVFIVFIFPASTVIIAIFGTFGQLGENSLQLVQMKSLQLVLVLSHNLSGHF